VQRSGAAFGSPLCFSGARVATDRHRGAANLQEAYSCD
jgi:hypothetical protein